MADETQAGATVEAPPAEISEPAVAEVAVESEVAPETVPAGVPEGTTEEAAPIDPNLPAKDRAMKSYMERTDRMKERLRDELGRFVSDKDTGESQEEVQAEVADEAPSEPEASEEVVAEAIPTEEVQQEEVEAVAPVVETPPAEAQPQQDLVQIPLPDGHPLRDRGREFITSLAEEEREVRAAINNYAKRQEIDQVQQQLDTIQEENIRLRAQLEANTSLRDKLLSDPEIRREYEEIRLTSNEAANRWLRGLEAEMQPDVQARVDEEVRRHRDETQRRRIEATVREFRSDIAEYVNRQYPQLRGLPHLNDVMERAFQSYGSYISSRERAGHPGTLDKAEFVQNYLSASFIADPQIREALQARRREQQREQEERSRRQAEATAAQKAKDLEAQKLREAAERHRHKSPVAQVPSAARTGERSTPAEEPFDAAGKSAADIKRHMRDKWASKLSRR